MASEEKFDPYRKWLGISPKDQPPHHYRLLGVELFESDPDVIESAADARMAHLRTFQTGGRSELSQKLLNELARARTCLLNPDQKADYDAELKAQLQAAKPAPAKPRKKAPPPAAAAQPAVAEQPSPLAVGGPSSVARVRGRRKKSNPAPLIIAACAVVAIAAIGGIVFVVNYSNRTVAETPDDPPNEDDGDLPTPGAQPPRDIPSPDPPDRPAPDDPDTPTTPHDDPADNEPSTLPEVGGRELVDAATAPVDVLPLLDTQLDTIAGQWTQDAESGHVATEQSDQQQVIQLPCRVPPHYTLTLTVHRVLGQGPLAVVLPVGAHRVRVIVDEQSLGLAPTSGLSLIDGKSETLHEGQLLDVGGERTLVCAVLDDRLSVYCDRQPVVEWQGDFSTLSINDAAALQADRPYLEVDRAAMRISACRIEPIADPATFALAPAPADDASPQDDEPSPLAPLPDAESIAEAQALLKKLYGERLAAARTPEAALELVNTLIDQGAGTAVSPAERFVVLNAARKLAAQHADVNLALSAIDNLNDHFQIDTLKLKTEAIEQTLRTGRTSAARLQVAQASLAVAQQAVDEDRFAEAVELLDKTINISSRIREVALAKQARALRGEVVQLQRVWPETEAAQQTLEQTPDDPAANLTLGRFYALLKGDWQRGLPLLAKGPEDELAALARDDTQQPEDGPQRVALADRFMELARTAESPQRENLQTRAYYWYRQALPQLSGLSRTNVERILADAPTESLVQADPSAVRDIRGFDVRKPEYRDALLSVYGGDAQTEAAVAAALQWLVDLQDANGSWNYNLQTGKLKGQCSNPGTWDEGEIRATSIALLPLLASGSTHQSGKHKTAVRKGLQFLISKMQLSASGASLLDPDGLRISAHGMATICLCEAYGMTGDKQLAPYAQQTLNYTVNAQSPDNGGWDAKPREPGRYLTAFIWCVHALHTADKAKLDVPARVWDRSGQFLDKLQVPTDADDELGARYYLMFDTKGKPSTQDAVSNAGGTLGRLYLGWDRSNPALEHALAVQSEATFGSRVEANFYINQVRFHDGGPSWTKWNEQMKRQLLEQQSTRGADKGSWFFDNKTTLAAGAGRLYHTGLATLMLQVYYRYPKLLPAPATP